MKMTNEEFEDFINVTAEKEEWLKNIMKTCLAHKHYIQQTKDELHPDDEGMNEISNAVLYMYGLLQKHGVLGHETDKKPSLH